MKFKAHENDAGMRLDVFISSKCEGVSRSQAKKLIDSGFVTIGERTIDKASHEIDFGDLVEVAMPKVKHVGLVAQDIPLDIVYEDSDIIVINKAAGMVVHPAAGNHDGTLVNALMHHCRDLGGISGELRPGIVHRLDKDTSGLIIVAKNDRSMASLMAQFKSRSVEKRYTAILWGMLKNLKGTISAPIGRSAVNRKKMSVRAKHGRDAVTHFAVEKRFGNMATLVDVLLGTGRTHQIRVHFSSIGHPILGDSTYGRAREIPCKKSDSNDLKALAQSIKNTSRTMLHSRVLSIDHPTTGKRMTFEAQLPQDMRSLLDDFNRVY